MTSKIFIIFLITACVNCLNYDREPRLVKSKTVDYRVSLRQILRLPEVNRPPFNLFKSREEFVKLAEQNIKNYKPYNYKLYRPYNPSKPAFIYDRDYVTKVPSSLGLLRPLQNVPSNPRNTSHPVFTTSTESPKQVNNSFVNSESNGRETTTTTGNSNDDINTTTNSYTEQTTDAAVSITENGEITTELTTESYGFSIYTTEGYNLPNYSTMESVRESNRSNQTTTDANTKETSFTNTDNYTILTPNAEDSLTEDDGTIVQSSTDRFGIANTTDILSYSSTEPAANAESQYTTEITTTERIEPETENLLLTGSNRVETTTTSNTQDGFNPTTPDVAAFITQFGLVPTSITENTERTTELTTESFGFPINAAQGSNFPNYSTTESITESNRIESTTDANIEETIFTTSGSYTTLTSNTEDSSTVDEATIVQSSTDSFGIANTTDILSSSSTEPAANAVTQYTTEISTTERIEPETENLLLTGSNRVETTTTSNTQDGFNPTTPDVAAFITQFAEDVEKTTELTTPSVWITTNRVDSTDIPNYSTKEPVTSLETTTLSLESDNAYVVFTESNQIETATNIKQSIPTTTDSSTEQTVDSSTTLAPFPFPTNTAQGTYIPYYSTTESVTESNRINQTTTDANTEETIFTTSGSYTTLTFNTEDSSTVDEATIVQSSTDSFGIANTTDILSSSSTEPAANAVTQYTTEISTTERIEPETENLLLTGSNRVETTTTSNTQDGFNPTTPDVAAFITQFGHVPTSTAEDVKRTTELTRENFDFPINTAEGTNIPYYSTTRSVTESNRIESTTDANTEETIYTTTDIFTKLVPNAEDSSTAGEETITEFSTTRFGIATITDSLSFSSTEPATNVETHYTTEISTTDCIEPESENLVFTGVNRVESTTTSKTEEDVDPTSTDAIQFENSEDAERTTKLTTESLGFPTNAADVTNIPDYSTTESVTESNRINQTTTHAYTKETIYTTTDSYTTLTPNAEASLTVDEETIAQSSTESVGIAITANILSYTSTETATNAENVYATEISTTDCMEPENGNLVFTNSNRVETTTTSNTVEDVSPTTNSYTEQATDGAAFKPTTEIFSTLNALDVEKTTELTTPSVWITTNRDDGTDIPNYSTKEPVTSLETTTLSLELDNAYVVFTESNQIETATNIKQSIPTTTDSSTEQTVDSSTTLAPNITEEPITELTMESWDIERTTKTDVLKYSTPEYVIFTSTVNPNDTMISTIESLTTETNRMETITTANDNNDIHTTTNNYKNQTRANPTKAAYETENYTTSGVVDVESTTLGFDIESTSQICEETTETENFPETIVPSETVTAEQFENVTFTTEATEISIEETMELNEKTTVNIFNDNTTEQEAIVFSNTDNFNLEDSIGTTTQISKETESLADLLQHTTESFNEVSTQAFDSTSVKDITESTTNVVLELWNMSTTPLLEDITTEMYEVSSTSALMDNSFTSNALISTITELPTLSTREGNDEITTEISQIECTTEQVEETTIEAEEIGETFEKSATELMLTEISDIETTTERSLKNIVGNNKGNATARVLLTDDTTASETYNEIVSETFEQSTNQFVATSFQESTTEVMNVNTTKQIASPTPISLVDNPTNASPILTTEHLIDIKSNTVDNKSNEETSVTPSNHFENVENPSIEPLYSRQQNLTIKNLNKESSKRKAKKFNYDTDVMPSLGDYDYI